MTKLEEIALAIFQAVTSDPEASWDTMSQEEREDALGWARAGLEAAREPSEAMYVAGESREIDGVHLRSGDVRPLWQSMINALLAKAAPRG